MLRARQGVFWPRYAGFSVVGGQSRGQTAGVISTPTLVVIVECLRRIWSEIIWVDFLVVCFLYANDTMGYSQEHTRNAKSEK